MAPQPVNATCLTRGAERYIFVYDDHHGSQAIQMAANWAANDDLSFLWYDAARIAQKIRDVGKQALAQRESRRWLI